MNKDFAYLYFCILIDPTKEWRRRAKYMPLYCEYDILYKMAKFYDKYRCL